jgi:hypothetical protein
MTALTMNDTAGYQFDIFAQKTKTLQGNKLYIIKVNEFLNQS